MPTLNKILEDNVIDKDEMSDFLWICNKFKTFNYFYDMATSDIQRLQGILHGILADNIISDDDTKRTFSF